MERPEHIDEAHQRFMSLRDARSIDVDQDLSLLEVPCMEASARNPFVGAVTAEVVIEIDGGGSITAIVAPSSIRSLGLAVGMPATAFFKASSVIVAATN